MWTIPIINGPNLNLIGIRQPEIYGTKDLMEYLNEFNGKFPGHHITALQSNHEGQLIDWLHEYREKADAIIINPGGLCHHSVSLRDAIACLSIPVAEVHLSDIYAREAFRAVSLIKDVCFFSICGHGLNGYDQALLRLSEYLVSTQTKV